MASRQLKRQEERKIVEEKRREEISLYRVGKRMIRRKKKLEKEKKELHHFPGVSLEKPLFHL